MSTTHTHTHTHTCVYTLITCSTVYCGCSHCIICIGRLVVVQYVHITVLQPSILTATGDPAQSVWRVVLQ